MTKSSIGYIDGQRGILQYRGYPIEDLAEKSTFLEVAFLLIYGELPTLEQGRYFTQRVMRHTFIHEDLKKMISAFRYDAHPMGMIMSITAAMGTFHPEAIPSLSGQDIYKHGVNDFVNKQIHRILGTMSTICAYVYRHRIGRPFVDPSSTLNYSENYMYMMDSMNHKAFVPNPQLARALDILLILHAEHELNASTAAMRHLASTGADVYTCLSGAIGALYGPLHGGANEAVIRMLEEIGTVEAVPQFIADVKAKKRKLMGFGHRVYKSYDPRGKIIRRLADEVFAILGTEPLIQVALALEKAALSDDYFISKKLFPNVDFFSGLIYKAMGFPTDYYTVLFALARTAGWLAHFVEFHRDKEQKIVRPFQIYLGQRDREYVPITSSQRIGYHDDKGLLSTLTPECRRRDAGQDSAAAPAAANASLVATSAISLAEQPDNHTK